MFLQFFAIFLSHQYVNDQDLLIQKIAESIERRRVAISFALVLDCL